MKKRYKLSSDHKERFLSRHIFDYSLPTISLITAFNKGLVNSVNPSDNEKLAFVDNHLALTTEVLKYAQKNMVAGNEVTINGILSGIQNTPLTPITIAGILSTSAVVTTTILSAHEKRESKNTDLNFFRKKSWREIEKCLGYSTGKDYIYSRNEITDGQNFFTERFIKGKKWIKQLGYQLKNITNNELLSLYMMATLNTKFIRSDNGKIEALGRKYREYQNILDDYTNPAEEGLSPKLVEAYQKELKHMFGDKYNEFSELLLGLSPEVLKEASRRGYTFENIIELYTAYSVEASKNLNITLNGFGAISKTKEDVLMLAGKSYGIHINYHAFSNTVSSVYRLNKDIKNNPNADYSNRKEELRRQLQYFSNFSSVNNDPAYEHLELLAQSVQKDLESGKATNYKKIIGSEASKNLNSREYASSSFFFKHAITPRLKRSGFDIKFENDHWHYVSNAIKQHLKQQVNKSELSEKLHKKARVAKVKLNQVSDKNIKEKNDQARLDHHEEKLSLSIASSILGAVALQSTTAKDASFVSQPLDLPNLVTYAVAQAFNNESLTISWEAFTTTLQGDNNATIATMVFTALATACASYHMYKKKTSSDRVEENDFIFDKQNSWKSVSKYLNDTDTEEIADFNQTARGNKGLFKIIKDYVSKNTFSKTGDMQLNSLTVAARILGEKSKINKEAMDKVMKIIDPKAELSLFLEKNEKELISEFLKRNHSLDKAINDILKLSNQINKNLGLDENLVGDKIKFRTEVKDEVNFLIEHHSYCKSFCTLADKINRSIQNIDNTAKRLISLREKNENNPVHNLIVEKREFELKQEQVNIKELFDDLKIYCNAINIFDDERYVGLQQFSIYFADYILSKNKDSALERINTDLNLNLNHEHFSDPKSLFNDSLGVLSQKMNINLDYDSKPFDYTASVISGKLSDFTSKDANYVNKMISNSLNKSENEKTNNLLLE